MSSWRAIRSSYAGVGEIFRRYWRAYGGLRVILLSPYFHAALLLTALLSPYWVNKPWWEVALSVMPNLLGFTLAGFTIWLGFGSERFRALVSQPGEDGSPSIYVQVSASFVHFVVMQVAGLLAAAIALAASTIPAPSGLPGVIVGRLATVGQGAGFLLFVYAIATALAAAMGVFRVASWQDMVHRAKLHEASNENRRDG